MGGAVGGVADEGLSVGLFVGAASGGFISSCLLSLDNDYNKMMKCYTSYLSVEVGGGVTLKLAFGLHGKIINDHHKDNSLLSNSVQSVFRVL